MSARGSLMANLRISKRWFALLVALLLALSVAPALAGADDVADGEGPEGFYIVIMEEAPLGVADVNAPATKAEMRKLDKAHDKALRSVGASKDDKIHSYHFAVNGFAAQLTTAEAAKMAQTDGVVTVFKDVMRHVQTDNTPSFLGLDDPGGPWEKDYTGENVVVGVIDTGIWPEHPSVADDGTYGPAPASFLGTGCDFGGPADPLFPPVVDDPFACNNKLLAAKSYHATFDLFLTINGGTYDAGSYNSARDEDGHGTHTATTAAGNAGVNATLLGEDRGVLSGVAPRARVSVYKGCWNSTLGDGCFTSDLVAAINGAVADGVDVINYSIGGGASLNGADDVAFLFAADAGVWVATSAGNSGPGAATVGGPASVPWITAVGASTQDREFIGSVDLGDGTNIEGITVTGGVGPADLVDSEDIPAAGASVAQAELCLAGSLDPTAAAGKIVLCKRGAIARVAKSQNVQAAGGIGLVLYNSSPTQTLNTDNHYIPSLHISNADGLTVKTYIDGAGSGATATINGGVKTPTSGNVMAGFSSRGPNPVAADIIKPDVTAPGVNVLAGNTPTALLGAPGQLFQSISGTSMSSPHVAGVFALLKQANPNWSPAAAKSAIMTTARQDVVKEDGSTPADPFDFGAGHIKPGGMANKGSMFQPGLVYDAGLLEYAAFTCGTDQQIFTPGSCDFLAANGFSFDASDLNLASIGIAEVPGSQTVTRTVTSVAQESGWRIYEASVEAPAGYEVTVSPSRIRLKRGQSATFEVTVTNLSAPVGAWRYGSLTWNETRGLYSVRSPIAVKASLFNAPALVDGAGDPGSASFDVLFGYTGDYTAAAHGLEAAIANSGSVWQDPDQSFSPGDTAGPTPGAVAFSFPISGAAYVRMELPDPDGSQPEDLDLFVLNSSGDLGASSTVPATDEVVELVLPADDTYTAYVHGWAAVPDPTPFTLYTWVISATPGGNLGIDSAPASASIGVTGTIDISWPDLPAGTHFGAVSHSDAGGLLGLTLVRVEAS